MYLAYKRVLSGTIRYLVTLALVAVSTLFAFSQLSEVHASTAQTSVIDGSTFAKATVDKQSEAMLKEFTASISAFPNVLVYPKIADFKDKSELLADMQSVDYLLEKKDVTLYASAKEEYVQAAVVSQASLETTEVVAVKGEATVEETYSLNSDILLNLVNEHRTRIGLGALQKEDGLMKIAVERAPELFDEIFVNGNMHAGFYAREIPYYATENIIYNQNEQGAFQWWLNSAIHRSAIENPGHTHTGIACSGKTCSMIFSHFQPK